MTVRVAILLGVFLVELNQVVHVVSAAEEDGASLVYAGWHNVENAPSSGSGDTPSL
jgi:hypothetical protein